MRAHLLLCLGAAGCTGVAALPNLEPNLHVISDTPLCPFEAPAVAPTATWSRTGPPGASVQAVLSLGQGTVLVGSGVSHSSGLLYTDGAAIFRSTDQGQTVTRVVTLRKTQVNQFAHAVDGTVYAAVGSLSGSPDDGVWVSTDRGVSFTRFTTGMHPDPRVVALATSGTRVYALVRGTAMVPLSAAIGLFRREGQGDWVKATLTGVNPIPGGPLGAVAVDPTQPDRVYAADGARFYVSTNGGDAFTTVGAMSAGLGSPQGLLVAGSKHLVMTTLSGVHESTDDGLTWKARLDPPVPVTSVAASGAAILAGTVGAGLRRIEGATAALVGKCLLDAVVLAVAVAPDDPSRVWVGVNGGLYASTNSGDSFIPAGAGLDEPLGRVTVATFDGAPTAFVLSSAGLFSYDGLQRWQRRGDWTSTVAFADVAVSPDGTGAYLSIDEELFPGRYGVAGAAWRWNVAEHTVAPVQELEGNIAAARFDPSSPGRVFVYQRGSQDLAPSISTGVFVRAGDRFVRTALISPTHLVGTVTFRFSPLAVAPDGTVYAGARLANAAPVLLRSVDSGGTQRQVWSSTDWIAHGVFTDSAGAVYLTGTTGDAAIRRSTDKGDTFAPFDDGLTGLGRIAYSLAFDGRGGIIAATQGGVFYAADGVHFSALNDGFDAAPAVWSVAVLPATPKPIVLAGTSRGLFWRALP